MKDFVKGICREAAQLKLQISESDELCSKLGDTGRLLLKVSQQGGTIYACGNGGSAADAMHFCEELVARYKRERPGIKAMHFIDGATLTCWSNDYNYTTAFKRQAETFCSSKDVLVCFSTSGNSENIIEAMKAAKSRGCPTILVSGKDGGKGARVADYVLIVPAAATERIQEAHIMFVHIWCEILEAPPE